MTSNRSLWLPTRIALVACALAGLAFGCAKKNESTETSGQTSETPAAAVITSPVGFVWKWEGTQTPVERFTPDNPTNYTIEFLPDTTVVAQIDCNRGNGKFQLEGQSILIGPLATTRMACPPGSLDGQFAQQLEAARLIFFRGDTLFMDLFADSGTMVFTQLPEPLER